jgi:superfamily II DNA or RNA helicase
VYSPDVGEDVATEIAKLFEHANPVHQKNVRMGIRFDHRAEPRYIATWRREGPWLSLPRGGMKRVREVLLSRGFRILARDERTEGYLPILEGFCWPEHRRTLFPDQREALDAIMSRETCLIRAPTGSGKTTAAVAAIVKAGLPAIVLVWSGALFDQWVERVDQELGVKGRWLGEVRGSRKTIGPITIAMQQTVAKLPPGDPFFRFFGTVVFDEVQRASAATYFASTDPFPARYRIGISADDRRKDRKEFLTYDLFGDVALEIKRLALVEQGRVRDVEVRVVPTGWQLPESIATTMNPGERHRLMLDAMALDTERDELVLDLVREELANAEQILVFSLRVEHCRRLVGELASAGISAGLMLGGVENRQELRDAVEGMRAGRMRVAVGTVQAVGTGVDLPSVGVGIIAQPMASNQQVLGQVAGRVCRIAGGTEPARLYYCADPCRAKDWQSLFADDRPVLVRRPDGSWLDARKDRRSGRAIAFPEPRGIF